MQEALWHRQPRKSWAQHVSAVVHERRLPCRVCLPSFSWMNNSLGQSPCLISACVLWTCRPQASNGTTGTCKVYAPTERGQSGLCHPTDTTSAQTPTRQTSVRSCSSAPALYHRLVLLQANVAPSYTTWSAPVLLAREISGRSMLQSLASSNLSNRPPAGHCGPSTAPHHSRTSGRSFCFPDVLLYQYPFF